MTEKELEKYSSAFTLSDMEIFIFPELLYSLFLANIMSPEIWKWRDDPWFEGIERMKPLRRIHRVKQYIMDHYEFNLDLETWGLTDKQTEITRFRGFVDQDILAKSNALFGYEGDKYYFDIDIRRHFGLEKYDSEVIPYWKTETVEAMNAFRFKEEYTRGAGECVSLACLYAAALFIVARIPADRIYLMGTPLHSQNFILVDDGVITNNRRIVTRQMWYNGSELSALARRALENEQVTVVAHSTGFIHSVFPGATINPESFERFRASLKGFLETRVDFEIFINFLRDYSRHQKLFQLVFHCQGHDKFVRLEKAFGYEHGSKNRLGDKTSRKLFCEMDEEDLDLCPANDRVVLRSDHLLFTPKKYDLFLADLLEEFPQLRNQEEFIRDYGRFMHTEPKLPVMQPTESRPLPAPEVESLAAEWRSGFQIDPEMGFDEVITYLDTLRHRSDIPPHLSAIADLAFYAGRHMDRCEWSPFLKACLERNPVSVLFFSQAGIREVYETLLQWPEESIYSGNRLALPDEVVNYRRGDGIEKALTMANILRHRNRTATFQFRVGNGEASLSCHSHTFSFPTRKEFSDFELSL